MTTPPKPARVRKPRKPAPPPLTSRLDDASGEMLEKSIARLRKRQKTGRIRPQHIAMPVWIVAPDEDADSPVVRQEDAQTPGHQFYDYGLSLLELSNAYLETQPFEIAKHSWMLAITAGGRSMRLVEGVATSHEQARERVEACWRLAVNAIMNG